MEGVVEPLRHMKPLGHVELLVVVVDRSSSHRCSVCLPLKPGSTEVDRSRPLKGCGSEALQRGIRMVDAQAQKPVPHSCHGSQELARVTKDLNGEWYSW